MSDASVDSLRGNAATHADRDASSAARRSDRRHVLHPWSAHQTLQPVVVTRAEGAHFWDEDGRRWLDFSSQLVNVNVGHQHPKLIAAIKAQAETLCTLAPYHANEATSEAARLIAELAPGDLDRVFLTNGGAEAVENAIRMARLHTGRHKVLTAYRSYHGATAGAIAASGDPRRWPSEPGAPGIAGSGGRIPIGRRSTPRMPQKSATARSRTSRTRSCSKARRASRRSSWKR
jgi:taurine--2-oxoglutarate transaminase